MRVTLTELRQLVRESVYTDAIWSSAERALQALQMRDLEGARENLRSASFMAANALEAGEDAPGHRSWWAAVREVDRMLEDGDLTNLPRAVELVRTGLGEVTGDEGYFEPAGGSDDEARWREQGEDAGDYLDKRYT